jgi:RNA methyltransferase, TrmH family
MIVSPQNEKLKLVRKLRDRKHREREELFATEGEDLVEAGLAAGAEPRFLLSAAGSGLGGEEVEPELLAATSSLGSGTRAIAVWPLRWSQRPGAPCVYLHGVADPGNVGAILRTAHALLDGTVVLGPGCADPFSPKAVRASMGSIFARPPARAEVAETPAPRVALVAHGGAGLEALEGAATFCLGAEREGLPPEVLAECEVEATIPLRPGAESLNVAAAAAIAAQRISSAAMSEGQPDA